MEIAVIGGGRVGLPAAAGLAALGHRVVCCEADKTRRETAAAGEPPFEDEGLAAALAAGRANGGLRFCADIASAVAAAEVVFLAVPTASGDGGLRLLFDAAAQVAGCCATGTVLAVKSTVPPGTAAELARRVGDKISVASNPEFLRQGKGLRDFLQPSRIVVGAEDATAAKKMREVYAPLLAKTGAKAGAKTEYIETNWAAAELAKLAANMFLASRVALVNELADVCAAAGADIGAVARVVGLDGRIGGRYLRAGVGFGGACLPKDGELLLALAARRGVELTAVRGLYVSNRARPAHLARRVLSAVAAATPAAPVAPVVAAWGAAFKPGADDVRDSPALEVIRALCAGGAQVRVCEAAAAAADLPPGAALAGGYAESVAGADVLVVLLPPQGAAGAPPLEEIARQMRGKLLFDFADALDGEAAAAAGLEYRAIGRPDA